MFIEKSHLLAVTLFALLPLSLGKTIVKKHPALGQSVYLSANGYFGGDSEIVLLDDKFRVSFPYGEGSLRGSVS